MNKNYIFVGVGIAVVGIIAIIALSQSSTVSSMTLDEILKNKDCKALEEWEKEHIYDDDLEITSAQMTEGAQLTIECTGKVLDNVIDTSSLSQPDEHDIKITLDKKQYKIGEIIQVDVTISPNWYHGIVLGIDDSSRDTFNAFDIDQDSKYNTSIKISNSWDIGMHDINLRNNPFASSGYVSPIVEFEIIE